MFVLGQKSSRNAFCHQFSCWQFRAYSTVSSWAPRQPPSEQRALQWLAFARQCTGHNLNSCSWDLPAFVTAADDLACSPPYRVPLSHFNVIFHEASIAAPQVLQALNGSLVALTKAAGNVPAGNTHAATTAVSECLGIGIVRSVDPAKQLLYILTPTPLKLLHQATTLEVTVKHTFWMDLSCHAQRHHQ